MNGVGTARAYRSIDGFGKFAGLLVDRDEFGGFPYGEVEEPDAPLFDVARGIFSGRGDTVFVVLARFPNIQIHGFRPCFGESSGAHQEEQQGKCRAQNIHALYRPDRAEPGASRYSRLPA